MTTLAVSAMLARSDHQRPPLVLIHGAANSAGVWTYWQQELAERGWSSYALDLRGHGRSVPTDLPATTMQDYADDVAGVIRQLRQRPVVMGWSMGGLTAMMAAATGHAVACIGLAPSMPALEHNPATPLRQGEFGPEEYGILSRRPEDLDGAMPDLNREERMHALASLGRESRPARDERASGIIIRSIPCPLLLVTGSDDRQWPASRYDGLWLPADRLTVEGASHWGLVLSRRAIAQVLPALSGWLEANCGQRQEPA